MVRSETKRNLQSHSIRGSRYAVTVKGYWTPGSGSVKPAQIYERSVGAVRTTDRAELVHRHLTENRLVAQGLEHFAVKLAGEVNRACNPVVERDAQPVLRDGDDFHNTRHHLLTPVD